MRKFWRTSLGPFGQDSVEWEWNEIPGEGCTSLPRVNRVKPGWSFACLPYLLMVLNEGGNGSFITVHSHKKGLESMKIFLLPWPPRGLKKKRRPEAMPKFLILMCIYGIFATVTVLRGTRWVLWQCLMYLKTNSQHDKTSVVFFSAASKNSSVWVMFWILYPFNQFATLRCHLLDVFVI